MRSLLNSIIFNEIQGIPDCENGRSRCNEQCNTQPPQEPEGRYASHLLGAAAPANDEQQTAQHATNPNTRRQIRFAHLGAAAPANANSHRPPTKPRGAAEQDNTICAYVTACTRTHGHKRNNLRMTRSRNFAYNWSNLQADANKNIKQNDYMRI